MFIFAWECYIATNLEIKNFNLCICEYGSVYSCIIGDATYSYIVSLNLYFINK